MLKYTKHTLQKLEHIYKEAGYQIRYGKGNFGSGYCLLNEQQIIVVNKFYDTEARISCLTELLVSINIEEEKLAQKTRRHFQEFLKHIEQV